jgi:methyl-accepting chemotaxis protein
MIYSVYKESDYATNFKANGNGTWKDSGLGAAFEKSIADPDTVHYIDWSPYGPSGGALAAFFSIGIRDQDGFLVGVYSIQLPPDY